jgi:hypothetical protein
MRSKHLDSLLFAIGVHGPTVAFEHLSYIRRLRTTDKDAFHEVKMTLIEAGMEHGDVMEMVLGRHPLGCACWRCVLMLHTQALRHHVRLNQGGV